MQGFTKFVRLASLLSLGACSTLAVGSREAITVTPSPSAQSCVVSNIRESMMFTPPVTGILKRSMSDLHVTCVDQASNSWGEAYYPSELEPHVWLNVFNLGLGLLVDWGTGAAYMYPDTITLPLDQPITASAPLVLSPTAPVIFTNPIPAPMDTHPAQ